jgi:uncharacterized protein involved in type VI secretion and phage assembly
MTEIGRITTTDNGLNDRTASDLGGRFYGVYTAVVTDLRNPGGRRASQIEVTFPWLEKAGDLKVWARYASMMAGADRGTFFLPNVGDEVLVAFEAGNVHQPYVIGALWNGEDEPPEQVDSKATNPVQSITSKNGIKLSLTDLPDGGGQVTIETPGGRVFQITDDGNQPGVGLADGNGNSVTIDGGGTITVQASGTVRLQGNVVDIDAATVNLNTAMCRVDGVVHCGTLITNSVVSSSYTPGAGNVW